MNVYDSGRMADVLRPLGYESSEGWEGADLVLLNTCHIREKADEKVYSDLGRIKSEKRAREGSGQPMLIGVAGCVAQAEGEAILERAPYVDLVVGPQSYHQLPEMVTKLLRGKGHQINLEFPAVSKFDFLPEPGPQGVSAFLSVQEGCDKFCTFCVVPYTRGAEYSRAPEAVLKEARRLVEMGALEITLLGQNVNAYHGVDADGKEWNLAKLIRNVAEISGLARIRYTTSHPRDMDAQLIATHGEVEKLMPFLHLPVQSGSNRILKAMNRKHTKDDYLKIIEQLRAARPDIAFSSDFITGFPGETDADFEETLSLVRDVGYAQAYSFRYSARPGTPAAVSEQQVPEEVAHTRLLELQRLLAEQQMRYNEASIGREMDILFDREGKLEGQLLGKSPAMQSVHVMHAAYAGKIAKVKILNATLTSLTGEVIAPYAQAA